MLGGILALVIGGMGVQATPVRGGAEGRTPIVRAETMRLEDLAVDPRGLGQRLLVRDVPIGVDRRVDLEVTRFSVLTPTTQVVVRRGGEDVRRAFDAEGMALFAGEIVGVPGSSVFLARGDSLGLVGRIEDGNGGSLTIGWTPGDGEPEPVRVASSLGGVGDGLVCASDTSAWQEPRAFVDDSPAEFLIELAVDTDYDFFEMFDDEDRALEYLVALYGQVSFVFSRDSGIRVVLSFARIWTDPDDLYNSEGPLGEFQSHWQRTMEDVHRDVAQLCSGRRDFPFGGQAFLSAVCNGAAYSVTGYMGAGLGDPEIADQINSDLIVAAHELGHNFGAPHTHDRGLDTCNDAFAAPRRGPIMSYCGQSYSGGDANHDARFHTDSTRLMREYLLSREFCLDADCNANFIADAIDIADGTSEDVNANGVPDECEDCNENGQFDDVDIALGVSRDHNANGVPDECEADCDANGVPDDLDIVRGDALDVDANGVPDVCQVDCDGNGIADALDIIADMTLDIDRDARLDSCQDCDGDGVNDVLALDHEWNIWVGSLQAGVGVGEFFGKTGVRVATTDDAIEVVSDLIITPDRRVLVAESLSDRVIEFALDGTLIGDLVAPGAGGLDEPGAMLLTDRGTLLIASRRGDQVLEYDLADGSFLGALVEEVTEPFGLAYAPGGGLLVTAWPDMVIEFDIETGSQRRIVLPFDGDNDLDDARGLVVSPLGDLLVCSMGSDQVLRFDLATGEQLGQFNRNGTNTVLTLDEPWGIRVGPNGNIFVSSSHVHPRVPPDQLHLTQARIFEYDYRNGNYLRALVQGADTDLWRPSGFDFVPGGAIDCNMNFFPDACEIAMGLVEDADADGVPDVCQRCPSDLDGDGDGDADDFFRYLDWFAGGDTRADMTGSGDRSSRAYGVPDGEIDSDDFFFYLDLFAQGCEV